MANLKWVAVALVVLIALYLVTEQQQSRLQTRSDAVFPDDHDAIQTIELWTKEDSLKLVKEGDVWSIAGHDTLEIRTNRMDTFFDKAINVKKETMVSKNPENYAKYSVDDSTGTHVKLLNAGGSQLVYAVFGRSTSDWSHNYVRVDGVEGVFLTDASVMHMMYPRAAYWGEKPKLVEADSSNADLPPIIGGDSQ